MNIITRIHVTPIDLATYSVGTCVINTRTEMIEVKCNDVHIVGRRVIRAGRS